MQDFPPEFLSDFIFHALLLLACFLIIILFLLWRAFESKKRSNISLRVINKEIEQQNQSIRQAQEEILKKNNELQLAKEKAEAGSKAKQKFLSNMSHEIRTPLNAILGLSDLLIQENPRDEQKEYLTAIKFSGENLLVLINDILDITKIEEGKISIEKTEFVLSDLLAKLYKIHELKSSEKNLDLKFESNNIFSDVLVGDPVRLTQILNNLLSNAIKFTHSGKVLLSVEEVENQGDSLMLEFRVLDTGIGISQEQITRIFERFEQADADTTRKYGGSGLGLTITKHLLKMQNSDIRVVSEPGKGSEFSFRLKFRKGQKEKKFSGDSKITFDEDFLDNRNILLVEDNELNMKVANRFLSKWGAKVDLAENGERACQLTLLKHYDIILMDLQMPVMDGYEAVKTIRNNPSNPSVASPVIALTADAMIDDRQKLFEIGFDDYLTKPFNPADLKNILLIHLNKITDNRIFNNH